MKLQLQATRDLLSRYTQIWKAAWQIRDQLDPVPRQAHELAFLPAQLELIDSPLHPAPKWAMRAIIGFAALALLWACFGQLDVVAVAQGKVIPSGKVKTIQPLEAAVVKHIAVTDGQHVNAGDLLIELDATQTAADDRKARDALTDARLTQARTQALLDALDKHGKPILKPQADLNPTRLKAEQALADSQLGELTSKLATLDATAAQKQADLETTQQQIDKLKQTLPIAQQRAEDYKNLLDQNFMSKHGYLEKEQQRIEMSRDLAAQQSHAKELQAELAEQRQLRSQAIAEFMRQQLDLLNQAEQQLAQLTQETVKTAERARLTRLTAPTSGTVQQLAIHTVGGVVTPAQALLVIVPDSPSLEVEALVDNQDIGFVDKGQQAIVKIATFPYTRYGYLTGRVTTVSGDAIQDEKKGLVFDAHVALDQNRLKVENKWVNLTPGMAVTVEVKTGKRRVMEYFLSPLEQDAQEAMRER